MKIIECVQGDAVWHEHRKNTFNASDAPAMKGDSKYMTRAQLLERMATGITPPVDAATQARFDAGHRTEESARKIVEDMICAELYPVVGVIDVDGMAIGASFDGLTMDGATAFEHKLWNAELAEQVRNGTIADNPAYYWQMEQQMLVSQCMRVIFVCSDGTTENFESFTYESRPGRIKQLIDGWRQFREDLASFKPRAEKPQVVAAPVESLPIISYRLNGTSLTSNLADYRQAAEMLVAKSKTPLVTDQDFADREALCKAFGEAEKRIEVMCQQVLGEIKDVAEFDRQLRDIAAMFRAARLAGEKLVDSEKKARRLAIQQSAEKALADHIASLNKRFSGRVRMPTCAADFAGAMKGKRTIASLQDAVDTMLANVKIESNNIADLIQSNLGYLDETASGHMFLFADLQQLVARSEDEFSTLVNARIADHEAREAKRMEAERERIRQEESERAQRESEAKARAEANARAEAEMREREQARLDTGRIAREVEDHTKAERDEASEQAKRVIDTAKEQAKEQKPAPVVAKQSQHAGPNGWDMVQFLASHYAMTPEDVAAVLERDRGLINDHVFPF